MQIYPIDLAEFMTKGAIKATLTQEGLCLGLNNPLRKHFHRYVDVINAYVFLTQKFHLPAKISFTINANNTGFHFLFGAGRITFNDDDNDGARMCNDIVDPSLKASRFNNNFVPKDKDATIEIIYDYKFMQINVGGEERYFSTKEKYMKSKFTAGKNTEGFDIRFAIDQSEKVLIKQFSVTQYDEGETVPCIRPTKEEIIARNAAKLNTWYDWRVNFLAKCQPDENDKLRKIYIDLFDYINRNYITLFQENEIIDEPIKIDEACMKYLYDFALGVAHDDFKYKFIFEKIGLYKSDVLPMLKEFVSKCSINKASGYYAFLRCDLRELKTKTRPELESFTYYLSPKLREEIKLLDVHLMNLKGLKFTKAIEGYDFYKNRITFAYSSKMGFIYKLRITGGEVGSHASWYVITSRHPWYRLNDYSQDMFEHIAKTSPETANELFSHYYKCTACSTSGCAVGTDYFYDGKKVRACHGRIGFGATERDFELIKLYVDTTDDLIKSGNPGQGMTTSPFYK